MKRRTVTISLTEEAYTELCQMAEEDYRTPSNMVRHIVNKTLRTWRQQESFRNELFKGLEQEVK